MKYATALALATAGFAAAAPGGPKNHWSPKKGHPGAWKPKHHVPRPQWPTKVLPPPAHPTSTSSSAGSKATALPYVDSAALQASILQSNLADKSQDLEDIAYATLGRNRVMGSEGHNNTVAYLVESIEALGDYYTVHAQPFIALYSATAGNLTVNDVLAETATYEYSPGGSITAELVTVANLGCNVTDFPTGVTDKIALVSRGTCPFGQKSALAGAAGAAGIVIYDNINETVSGGTLGPPPRPEGAYVPSIAVSQAVGKGWVASLAAGETLTGELLVDSDIRNLTTFNVIAESVGGNKNATLVIGAHSDSVAAGPGINDDGSGTVGILEVVEQLSKYSLTNSVRIAWWSGEEFGLLGSNYYTSQLTDAEVAQIRLYLNFDMIASPNYIYAIYDGDGSAYNISGPPGSAEAEYLFEDFFESKGLNSTPTAFDGRSDYGGFLDRGIAAGGLFTGAEEIKTAEQAALFGGQAGVALDSNYHQAGDNVTNLNNEAFVVNTQAIAAAVAEYATSWDSLPALNVTVTRRSIEMRASVGKRSAATGSLGKHCAHAVL
ncbi:hypothetical protein B0A48_18245 [Cryoendolithus antarcticus]|uniref:Peptide hydrolase n=1 Tax=Cryoendolithus antarcticus TaxID=1507870 RepID=A0A1V8S928_9PEZI|nr:hypothetical protein B0A48_18245 [Cryoendolithus antarcticus]